MAKSKSFFGLRRGSTKSHTYSVLNGQQITKDRVQSVANPKTRKQRYQRAIMATVMAAYSEMKEIEDHAFQGKKKGSENQREFMSKNLVAMRNAFLRYQEENPLESAQEFFAVGPKTPTVLPGAWVISNGTLPNTTAFSYVESDQKIVIPALPINPGESGGLTLNVGEAADELGLYTGLQVTFACITSGAGVRIFQVYPEDYAGYGDWEFHFTRFVVGSFDRNKILTSSVSSDEGSVNLLYAFLSEIADKNRSSLHFINSAQDAEIVSGQYSIDAELALQDAHFDMSLTGAIGVITSEVDTDLRSTSKMQVRNVESYGDILGLTWDYVPDAWRNSGGTLGTSDLYLEGGSV